MTPRQDSLHSTSQALKLQREPLSLYCWFKVRERLWSRLKQTLNINRKCDVNRVNWFHFTLRPPSDQLKHLSKYTVPSFISMRALWGGSWGIATQGYVLHANPNPNIDTVFLIKIINQDSVFWYQLNLQTQHNIWFNRIGWSLRCCLKSWGLFFILLHTARAKQRNPNPNRNMSSHSKWSVFVEPLNVYIHVRAQEGTSKYFLLRKANGKPSVYLINVNIS